MNTKEAIEKLPWLVNGSLDAREAAEVRERLADSESCRQALREIAEAGPLFGSRLPIETLLDYVSGREVAPFLRPSIERFLSASPVAAEELRMVSESWDALAQVSEGDDGDGGRVGRDGAGADRRDGDLLPFRHRAEVGERSARTWRGIAIAASLLAVLSVGGWWNELRDPVPGGFNPTLVVVEAVDAELVLRDGSESPVPVDVTTEDRARGPLQLSLGSSTGGTRTLEIIDARGSVVWAPKQEFRADHYGSFVVALPDDLGDGVFTVQLYKSAGAGVGTDAGMKREAAERYSIELRQPGG